MKYSTLAALAATIGSANACGQSYNVQPGEYCYKIAQDHGLNIDQFKGLNPGINCDLLQIGQSVCIKAGGGCAQKYNVQPGEYCYKIAQDHGMNLDQFKAINGGLNCDLLRIGQEVCIRGGNGGAPQHHQPAPRPVQHHNPQPVPAPKGGQLVSYDQFANAVQACGYPRPDQNKYNAFISSHAHAGGITTKRELAMFLSEIMHESGGLQYKAEIACQGNNCAGHYRSPGDRADKFYYGRGYIQLTWSYNYRAASKALYNDERLINNPEMVANDEKVAWETTFWFWKANVHSDAGVQNGQLGSATNKINGALECHPCRLSCSTRFEHYKKIAGIFGVNENLSNAGC